MELITVDSQLYRSMKLLCKYQAEDFFLKGKQWAGGKENDFDRRLHLLWQALSVQYQVRFLGLGEEKKREYRGENQ